MPVGSPEGNRTEDLVPGPGLPRKKWGSLVTVFCHSHRPPRRLRLWACGVAALAGLAGAPAGAEDCEGTTERIVGYSWQQDEYVVERRALDGSEPTRYVTRQLSTGDVLDEVACPAGGSCTAAEALGIRACSFRPLPRMLPDRLSLQPAADGDSEVRLAGLTGAVPLMRVRGMGRLTLRSGVRADSHVIVFLSDTIDPDDCGLTRERAVVVPDPDWSSRARQAAAPVAGPARTQGGKLPDVDLLTRAPLEPDLRLAGPLSPDGVQPLTMAARAAAAVHLDALAGCWAQEALSILGQQNGSRAAARPSPSVEVEEIRVIVPESSKPSAP